MAAFANSTLPSGWLLCDGSAVSRTAYAALFTAIGTTYGAGDGSDTFALPNLTNKFIEGGTTVGTVKAAGLPNITATHSLRPSNSTASLMGSATGAMRISTDSNSGWAIACSGISTQKASEAVSFDASRSSSVYGNSTTVQPPAITMKFAIYAGDTSLHRWIRTA